LPAGVAINGNGYDTSDQFQSENSGLNFHDKFPDGVPTGFTFIHTLHNRIYRKEGNGWAVLLEGYTPQSGEHLWRRVSTGSPNIRNVPIDGFVGVNTDPDFRLHVLENRNDTIALFEGGSNNDIAEVKIFNSNVRSRSRPGGGIIVGGDALLTFETTNNATWSVGITADYNNDNQRDNFFVISVNNRFGPYNQSDPSDDYLIITPNGAVGIGNNHVPNTNLPTSATLPNNGFYKLDIQGNANVWEQTTTRNFRMWDQNPQFHSLLTAIDTQGNAAWKDFVTLGLVTNAENIPTNLDEDNSGWPFVQKVGTVLQFRKIVGEENQNHRTLFKVRTNGNLIRVGLTSGDNGNIIWRNYTTGVYEWTHPSSIRNLLGLGTLTVSTLDASSRVLQVNPNTFNPANNAAQNINIGFIGGSNGQFLTVNNGTYQWASFGTLTLNNTTPTYLSITPNTYNPNNNQTINIGLAGDLTQRGSLVAGANITLSGNTANRLVGSGDVTITVNIPPGGGGGNTGDQDWLVAQNNPTGVPNPPIPNNINQWIYTNGNVGIGTGAPANALHVFRLGFNPSQNDAAAIRVEGNVGGGIVFSEGNNRSAIYSPAGSDLVFATGGSSGGIPGRVHIDSIGRVGVNISPWHIATLTVYTPWSHIDNAPLLNWGNSQNAYLWTFGQFINRIDAVNRSQTRANNSSSISAFRQEALYVANAYSTSAKTYMNGVVTAVTAGPNPDHPNVGLLGLCETNMCMQTGPLHSPGTLGSPMIDNPPNVNNSFRAFYCRYDLAQVPNNCRPFFIFCYSSDNIGPNWNDAGHFVVHARGHMQLFSPAGAVAYKNGSSTWANISDARLKTNIQPITNALEKITKLRGVSFDWINQDLHKGDAKSGFLAQEMEQVFPDCVQEVEVDANSPDAKLVGDGKIKTVGLTTGFFASMVEAIKEQQQIIEGLQKTVAQQQQLIDLQNQKIAQLEQKLEELANKRGS
jgi:hypothetical protein